MPTGQPSSVETRVPVFALFNFAPSTYAEISTLAFRKQQGICHTMQTLIELGLQSLKDVDPQIRKDMTAAFEDLHP